MYPNSVREQMKSEIFKHDITLLFNLCTTKFDKVYKIDPPDMITVPVKDSQGNIVCK